MKKTKIIVLSLFISIMLIGAGYAAWTEKIGLDGIVKTGDLKVELYSDSNFPYIEYNDNYGFDYVNSSIIQLNKKKLRVIISNLYPGAVSYIGSKIKNTGSKPAIFNGFSIEFDTLSDLELKSNLKVAGNFIKISNTGDVTHLGSFVCKSYELEKCLESILHGIVLEPGDLLTFDNPQDSIVINKVNEDLLSYNHYNNKNCILFYLPINFGNNSEKKTIQFDLSIDFKKFNQ